MEDPSSSIILLLVLLVLSAFFSGAEIALFSLTPAKMHAAKKGLTGKKRARFKWLDLLKSNQQSLLVTILICNNVVNIGASSMATILAVNFANTHGFVASQSTVIGLVTGIMTFLILLFGEITPKALAHRYALKFSLIVAPVIVFLRFILMPIVYPLALFTKSFIREEEQKHGLTEDELKAAVELSEKEGSIEPDEKEMVEKVLEFDTHMVEDIMTPRSKMFTLTGDVNVQQALMQITEVKHSRIPVQDKEDQEKIIGILTVHILIEYLARGGNLKTSIKDLDLQEARKIPLTMKISSLMKLFQREKTSHMGVVYDEHGGFIGLITMEDVLEEIFGEIHDETDQKTFSIQKIENGVFKCGSNVELEHIETYIKENYEEDEYEEFPWEEKDENNTLNYFLLEQFERYPKKGESLELETEHHIFVFTVAQVKDGVIEDVRITLGQRE